MTRPGHNRIGIDFDNTVISYDTVFLSAAIERGLVGPNFSGTKQAVRDAIRLLPDGEHEWQRLQGYVYGQGIADAVIFDGLDSFLRRCRREDRTVMIVSHKTEYGHFDPARVNLRQAALGWMKDHGFFADDGFAIPRENVHFESTRAEKLRRIRALDCTLFIDDLPEVLDDPDFPANVERLLLSQNADARAVPYAAFASWREIEAALLAAPN